MKPSFELTIDELLVVDELPGTWTDEKYREILTRLEIPDVRDLPPAELPEMCIMALQDLDPLFRGAWLVSKAFPRDFPTPEIARVDFRQGGLSEATVLRLLAGVMDSSSILLRMFGDRVNGAAFPEVESLLWTLEQASDSGAGVGLRIHASRYILRGLPGEGTFEVHLAATA